MRSQTTTIPQGKPPLLTIFTDGASSGNPGPGGFGAIIIAPKSGESGMKNYEVIEIGGREEHTTNNRMELTAAIKALESPFLILNSTFLIQLYTDSSYLIHGITKWVYGWRKNNWKTAQKKDVENRDLWEQLSNLVSSKKISWNYVGGHAGVPGNERCDEIATGYALNKDVRLYEGPLRGYPVKNILDTAFEKKTSGSKNRSRSKVKAYSYLSLLDGRLERHQTWAECERRVKGKNAKFKKSLSAEDEKTILRQWGVSERDQS